MTEQEQLKRQLVEAMKTFHGVFKKDADLVRGKAKAHHIKINEADILTKPRWGEYNVRLPRGARREVDKLLTAKKIVIGCMDSRQSKEIYDTESPDIIILNAGGGAQPTSRRAEATVNFLSLVHQMNPEAEIVLLAHTGVCGGVNHFTGGLAERESEKGETEEIAFLKEYLLAMQQDLLTKGVAPDKLRLKMSHVGKDNTFMGVRSIENYPGLH